MASSKEQKEYNDALERMLKEIETKESIIVSLKSELEKERRALQQAQVTANKSVLNQQSYSKKLQEQLKEANVKLGKCEGQLRKKMTECEELKDRLAIQKKLEEKQKDHVAELMKKSLDRKPGTLQDQKIAALIQHYEGELNKKDQLLRLSTKLQHSSSILKPQHLPYRRPPQDSKIQEHSQDSDGEERVEPHQIQHSSTTDQNPQIFKQSNLNEQISKDSLNSALSRISELEKILVSKNKELDKIQNLYQDLTKEYYRILNSSGIQNSSRLNDALASGMPSKRLLAAQPLKQQNDQIYPICPKTMVTASSQILPLEPIQKQSCSKCIGKEEILRNICEIFEFDLKSNELVAQFSGFAEALFKRIASLLSRLMHSREVPEMRSRKRFEWSLCEVQQRVERLVSDLDQIWAELGYKKGSEASAIERVRDLRATEEEYIKNMKSLSYVKDLPKAQKIIEIMEFFELDKESLQLPRQLVSIYESMKAVRKFLIQIEPLIGIKISSANIERNLAAVLDWCISTREKKPDHHYKA